MEWGSIPLFAIIYYKWRHMELHWAIILRLAEEVTVTETDE
jgi:hypothetical protein